MRLPLVALILSVACRSASPPAAGPVPVTFEHTFGADSLGKAFSKGKGAWEPVADGLRGHALPEEHHHATIGHKMAYHDATIELSFRYEGASLVGVWMNTTKNGQGEHVCRVAVQPDRLQLYTQTGMGPTTTNKVIGERPIRLEAGRTYTLRVSAKGQDLVAQLDGGEEVRGSAALTDVEKTTLTLGINGDGATFRSIRVWTR
jgi:hypothetical protein